MADISKRPAGKYSNSPKRSNFGNRPTAKPFSRPAPSVSRAPFPKYGNSPSAKPGAGSAYRSGPAVRPPQYSSRTPQTRNTRVSSTPNKAQATSWGKVAEWYKGLVEDDSSYQKQVVLPNLLRILDVQPGERVLDLACGEGIFARELARLGAHVTGVDISPELIGLAKDQGAWNIRYHIAPADKLPDVPNSSIDTVIIVLALQNMPDLNSVIQECARVLRSGGRLVCVMNHPAFRIPKSSNWGWDEREHVLYRRVDKYLSEARVLIQMHPGDRPEETTVSFHRPLQIYFKSFSKHGFLVRRLEEWISNRKSQPGPRATGEDKARKEFPLFLCIEAVLKSE